jgi:hypothetical protein
LRENPSRLRAISGSALAILLAYAILTYPNTIASFSGTEYGAELSYGVNVIPLYMEQSFGSKQLSALSTLILPLVALGLCLVAFYAGSRSNSLAASESRHLSAFRLGAMIYVGTFFLGNNWDYRLIFLLFTVPQLVEWTLAPPGQKLARWTIASLVIACWYLIILNILGFVSAGEYVAYFLDQVSKWALFIGLCHFFMASAPDWLKLEIQKSFERRRLKPI